VRTRGSPDTIGEPRENFELMQLCATEILCGSPGRLKGGRGPSHNENRVGCCGVHTLVLNKILPDCLTLQCSTAGSVTVVMFGQMGPANC
jgi:hypothetical protein